MDASVAVKWFLPENGEALVSQARSLLDAIDKIDKEEVRFAWAAFRERLETKHSSCSHSVSSPQVPR